MFDRLGPLTWWWDFLKIYQLLILEHVGLAEKLLTLVSVHECAPTCQVLDLLGRLAKREKKEDWTPLISVTVMTD